MPENIPIRERILRQVATNLEGVTGIGTVRRWDGKGTANVAPLDCFVVEEDESALEGPNGGIGYTDKHLPLLIAVVLFPDESSSEADSWTRNRWQARLEEKIVADPYITEAITEEKLAIDVSVVSVDGPDLAEGSISAAIRALVVYRHERTNPYRLGTLITVQAE